MDSDRKFTRAEIEGRNTAKDVVVIIDNVVYDVTEFLEEHPGGAVVLLDNGGKDASRCFHEVGHSDVALEWRQKFRVGEVVPSERWQLVSREELLEQPAEPLTLDSLLNVWGPPLGLGALAALLYIYLF